MTFFYDIIANGLIAPSGLFCKEVRKISWISPKKNSLNCRSSLIHIGNVQKFIAEGLGVTLSEVYGVATFYAQFSLHPKGEYLISVCLGTACYVKGSQSVLDKLSEVLEIPVGGTTPDGRFTLEATRCLGACGLAPVMMINGEVYGRLTPDAVPGIIAKYKAKD